MLAVNFEITFEFVQGAIVLLQHKGRLQQAAEGLLVENWFVVIGHAIWHFVGLFVRHDISQAEVVGRALLRRDSPEDSLILEQVPRQHQGQGWFTQEDVTGGSNTLGSFCRRGSQLSL